MVSLSSYKITTTTRKHAIYRNFSRSDVNAMETESKCNGAEGDEESQIEAPSPIASKSTAEMIASKQEAVVDTSRPCHALCRRGKELVILGIVNLLAGATQSVFLRA